MFARLSIALVAVLLLARCALSAERTSVRPAVDADAILHNPEMGWVVYENYPIDPRPGGSSTMVNCPGESFPGVGHVAIMFAWSDVEKQPNVYDFSAIDRAYEHWSKLGKQIQLRMSTETLLWWNTLNPPSGVGVPRYVLDKLPVKSKQERKIEGTPYVVVDARGSFYLERLEEFLAAVATHYNAARPVTYVDLRGFGVWGEWHSGFQYESVDARRDALKGVIDRYCAAFPDHPVALSYSHDPDGPKEFYAGPTHRFEEPATKHYDEFLRYSAFDYALTKSNIAWRRDGCGTAVYSNQRKFCDDVFTALKTGPMMSEFCGGYADNKKAGEQWLNFVIDDALSLHPNYVNLLGWQGSDALAFLKERPELIAKGLRTMGYRLVPSEIRYPPIIAPGEPIAIGMDWSNTAVGRTPRDFYLVFMFGDRKMEGGVIPSSRWVKDQTDRVKKEINHDLPPGEYDVRFYLEDRKHDQRIALPLRGGRDRTYPLGMIRVTGSK